MSYKSPITMYTERIVKDIIEKQDGYLMECVHKVGFDINKDELAKALAYDRDQYGKGYHDGRMYQPPVKSNADRIRSMTDEELAEVIRNPCDMGIYMPNEWCKKRNCGYQCSLDWLKLEGK